MSVESSPACFAAAAERLDLTGVVDAVCVVHQLTADDSGPAGVSGIDKRPVHDPVTVRALGLHGDVQADRKSHGGEDQAVYAYAAGDADWWAGKLDREITPGSFGENLRISGLDVDGAVPGEQWRIGRQVVLEATRPRIPCGTFARWMGEDRWVRRFLQAGRTGTYFRVITSGEIAAGDAVEVIAIGEPGPAVREIARALHGSRSGFQTS